MATTVDNYMRQWKENSEFYFQYMLSIAERQFSTRVKLGNNAKCAFLFIAAANSTKAGKQIFQKLNVQNIVQKLIWDFRNDTISRDMS